MPCPAAHAVCTNIAAAFWVRATAVSFAGEAAAPGPGQQPHILLLAWFCFIADDDIKIML